MPICLLGYIPQNRKEGTGHCQWPEGLGAAAPCPATPLPRKELGTVGAFLGTYYQEGRRRNTCQTLPSRRAGQRRQAGDTWERALLLPGEGGHSHACPPRRALFK